MKYFILLLILFIASIPTNAQDYAQQRKQIEDMSVEDQKYRKQLDSVEKRFGTESIEIKALWKTIHAKDSVNKIAVIQIIDKYGWLGPDQIGESANIGLFFMVMHFDFASQKKYLPIIRTAVKEGKAAARELALLEDRVALKEGKKQLYGTQIRQDDKRGEYYIAPLEDPDNVDKRRKEMGLIPLAEYVKQYNIIWDPKTYVLRE